MRSVGSSNSAAAVGMTMVDKGLQGVFETGVVVVMTRWTRKAKCCTNVLSEVDVS